MVSWSGHILPVLLTVAIWFFATGLIAWLDNRDRDTFPRSLVAAGLAGVGGLCIIFAVMQSVTATAIYASFIGAILVWSWHEVGFLTGAVAGPRRLPCGDGVIGWERFSQAAATLVHHEIALALTALLLMSLSWNAPNQVAAMTFALLYGLRLSTKLNIFYGVPNTATDILPPHLSYLKSYYGPNRMGLPLIASTIAAVALAAWLGSAAYNAAPGSADAIAASLLFALAVLGALEHLFLALQFRDGMLWGWALPRTGRPSSSFDQFATEEER